MKVLPMSSVSRNFILVLPSIIEIHYFEGNVKKVDKSTKEAACESQKKGFSAFGSTAFILYMKS